jgi:hypothetical protein
MVKENRVTTVSLGRWVDGNRVCVLRWNKGAGKTTSHVYHVSDDTAKRVVAAVEYHLRHVRGTCHPWVYGWCATTL